MTSRFSKKILLLLFGDILLLYGALALALFLRYTKGQALPFLYNHLVPFTIIFAFWLIIFGAFELYDLRFLQNSKMFLYRLLRAMATNVVLAIVIFYLLPIFEIEPRRNLFLIAFFSTALIFLWRYVFNILIIRAPASRVLFFGITKEAVELADFLLAHPQLGQKPMAFFSPNGAVTEGGLTLPHFSEIGDLIKIIRNLGIDTIVALREVKENKTLVSALFQVVPLGVGVIEFQKFYEMLTGKIPLSLVGEIWFLENLVGIRKNFYELFKRGIDIVVAILLSIPTALIFPFVALAVKLDSEGPMFYWQKRVGRHGGEFWLIKFRSMVKEAEKMGGLKENGRDSRHTRVGAFLRKSYLDELPQIINILKGEMSFVGPRPERPEYVRELKQKIPFYEMRLLVPPGITGWAQVKMENDASVEDTPEKMQYDLYYIKNRSFILDLLVILRTIFIILRREGR